MYCSTALPPNLIVLDKTALLWPYYATFQTIMPPQNKEINKIGPNQQDSPHVAQQVHIADLLYLFFFN